VYSICVFFLQCRWQSILPSAEYHACLVYKGTDGQRGLQIFDQLYCIHIFGPNILNKDLRLLPQYVYNIVGKKFADLGGSLISKRA
jgi:hypothetical protein